MSKPEDESQDRQAWRALAEAHLIEIPTHEFVERIRDVKRIVIGRLRELLDVENRIEERESAAYSLGTLKGLELKLTAHPPEPPERNGK